MKTFSFTPQGVCSKEMSVTLDDNGTVVDFRVQGGCHGNLQGIGALIKGMKVQDVITRLKGIQCKDKGTSCPDQLARGLEQILK